MGRGFHLPAFIDQATLGQAVLFGLFWAGLLATVLLLWLIRPGMAPLRVGGLGLVGGAVTAGIGGWLLARRDGARRAADRAEVTARRAADTERAIREIKAGKLKTKARKHRHTRKTRP